MELLLKNKRVFKSKFTRLQTLFASKAPEEQGLESDIDRVEKLEKEGNDLLSAISQNCSDTEFDLYEKELGEIDSKLYEMKRALQKALKQQQVGLGQMGTVSSELRLPRIDLPTFSGSYENWVTFHDLFVASIDRNVTLSNAQKLQYLKSAVKGEAAILIKAFPITDANYNGAWSTLVHRYQNNREIMNAHLERLTKQPYLTGDNPAALRKFVDTTTECIKSIQIQGAQVEHWDVILIFLVTKKLDPITRKDWELSLSREDNPTFENLMEFLDKRAHALSAAANTKSGQAIKNSKQVSSHHTTNTIKCGQCHGTHHLSKCAEFLKQNIKDRRALVKKLRLCFNCLKLGHVSKVCLSGKCQKCDRCHHTLVHEDSVEPEEKKDQVISNHSAKAEKYKQVLLGTAVVRVLGHDGQVHHIRILVDSASQRSFMTEACAQKLNVQRQRSYQSILTLGSNTIKASKGKTSVVLQSLTDKTFKIEVEALILTRITTDQPAYKVEKGEWDHCQGLQLADTRFKYPAKIDMLIGADIYAKIVKGGICSGGEGTPTAIQTYFGWVLFGEVKSKYDDKSQTSHLILNDVQPDIQQFWEVEDSSEVGSWTLDEQECELHFTATTKRDIDGRFILRLPFKTDPHVLGKSKGIAISRMKKVEQSWQHNMLVWQQYKDFMTEYLFLNHMESSIKRDINEPEYFLPHHAVLKPNSSTTKLRVVFDASSKSEIGTSLNDILLTGPKIQNSIVELLIRFRLHTIGLTADIGKMYRQ